MTSQPISKTKTPIETSPTGRDIVPNDVARRLLESVVAIADHHADLASRRRALVSVLAYELEADCGFWSWGYGKPADVSITSMAVVEVGLTEPQKAVIFEMAFDADTFRDFYCRIYSEMMGSPRSRSLRASDFQKRECDKLPVVYAYLERGGWSQFLSNARYFPENAYSSMTFLRNFGKPEFGDKEAEILEFAASSVSWLHANVDEDLSPEKVRGLTQRQRTVLTMILDGWPRKVISQRLGITEDTVGDHLKAIYTHFNVRSSIELAALFLQNR